MKHAAYNADNIRFREVLSICDTSHPYCHKKKELVELKSI